MAGKTRRSVWYETQVVKPDGTRKTWKVSSPQAGASFQRQFKDICDSARKAMWGWETRESARKAALIEHNAQHGCAGSPKVGAVFEKRFDKSIGKHVDQLVREEVPAVPAADCAVRTRLSTSESPPELPPMAFLEGGPAAVQQQAAKK
jgi:hypothetical protein